MNILFVSEDLVSGNLAYFLKKEGHEVRLYIKDPGRKQNFDNMIKKINDWRESMDWVGKNGLIVFDSCSHGKIQDNLRKNGYSVVGGSKLSDRLENDREYGSKIFKKYGMKTVPQYNFESIFKAINFIKKNKGKWVIKQNQSGTGLKSFNYVGIFNNGKDVIDVLKSYQKKSGYKGTITLQRKIDGIEIGIGRYFNGNDWIGPIEINLEHKKFFPGDLGPTTSEMGTIMWYEKNEKNKLFKETIGKMESYLRKINFKGDFDVNCIVNKKGLYPLEATPRFGSPAIHLQSEIHNSSWGEFLKAIADGKSFKLKWKKGFGIVIVVTVPTSNPFPFTKKEHYVSPKGLNIYFDTVAKKNMKHIHFEDVSMKREKNKKQFYISDDRGYVLYITAIAKSVAQARKKAYGLLEHIHIPKMFYRNDIGLKFENEDMKKLKEWGYINV